MPKAGDGPGGSPACLRLYGCPVVCDTKIVTGENEKVKECVCVCVYTHAHVPTYIHIYIPGHAHMPNCVHVQWKRVVGVWTSSALKSGGASFVLTDFGKIPRREPPRRGPPALALTQEPRAGGFCWGLGRKSPLKPVAPGDQIQLFFFPVPGSCLRLHNG